MSETSASIAQWQNETFGPAKTMWERVDRSDEKMRDAMWLARRVGRDDLVSATPGGPLDLPQRPNLSRAIRAAEELAELIEMLVADDNDLRACDEVADVAIVLAGILAFHGHEQQDLIDNKMKTNRARTWNVTGDGHGQHVKEIK